MTVGKFEKKGAETVLDGKIGMSNDVGFWKNW